MSEEQTEETQNKMSEREESIAGSTATKQTQQYFRAELNRIKNGLAQDREKVKAPPIQEHVPYTYNSLDPYYNCDTAQFIIELGDEVEEKKRSDDNVSLTPSYLSRKTALGMVDPWVNNQMDMLDKTDKPLTTPRSENKKKDKEDKKKEERPPKEGSTRLPKFPAVGMSKKGIKPDLYYSDVEELRQTIKQKIGVGAEAKVSQDYTRTKQDFFRMELDKMDEYHNDKSRQNMSKVYYAYLENTPGSKKAIRECLKTKEKATVKT